MTSIPPPPSLEDSSAVEAAIQRFASKKSRLSVSLPNLKAALHLPSKRSSKPKIKEPEFVAPEEHTVAEGGNVALKIDISSTHPHLSDPFQDVYQWAVLYENQRGMTIFSTPMYSSSALLPTDPAPFTIPSSSSQSRAHIPQVSLNEYPLPDGNWHWVSRAWMVDMRYSGEVQYDGFEYNWRFRQHHWRPEVGPISAGGWVRRRRWIRLMMRPGLKRKNGLDEEPNSALSPLSASSSRSGETFDARRLSGALSILTISTAPEHLSELLEIWSGNVEEDWKMCKQVMKMVGRSDGGRLELWRRWLGSAKEEREKAFIEPDIDPGTSTTHFFSENSRLGYVTAVLDVHGIEILNLFVYPESKRQFVELLKDAGIYLKNADGSLYKALQFHSLTSGLDLHVTQESKDDEGQ